MNFFKRSLCFFLSLVTSFFLVTPSFASTNRFSIIHFRPALGERDLTTTLGAGTLSARQFQLFTQFDYAHHPLQRTRNGARIEGIVDHLFIQHIGGSVGLSNWWQVDLQLPVVWYNRFSTPAVPAPPFSSEVDAGDFLLRSRFRLLGSKDNQTEFAVIPFVTLPTGNENHFVADNTVTGGLTLAVSQNLFPWLSMGVNGGVIGRERVQFSDLDTNSQITLSAGVKAKISKWLSVEADVATKTPFRHPFREVVSTPTEAFTQFEYHIPKTGLIAFVGGGTSVIRGAGVPDYRIFTGLSFTGRFKKKFKEHRSTVYFQFDSTEIDSDSAQVLDETGEVLKKDAQSDLILSTGHTDSIGPSSYNKRLSIKRAQSVKHYLMDHHGLEEARIIVEGLGELQPVEGNKTAEGRRLNRRVELEVTLPK